MATGERGEPQQIVALGDLQDRQTAALRPGLTTADLLTKAVIIATPAFIPRGRSNIIIGARFSVASRTCQVQIAYITKSSPGVDATANDNTIKGWSSVVTLTGSSSQKEGTYYEAPDAFFDGEGAEAVRVVLITAPASGTVDLWVGSK